MKYIGSKNKLSKDLVPIIQGCINKDTRGYLEPFVGGANMIDKIIHNNKIGCDIHEELIELLKYAQINSDELPKTIAEEEYIRVRDNKESYEKWYVGLVGFCATYSGKWFAGYARSFKSDGVTRRDMANECIRNIQTQAPSLENIKFINCNFLNLQKDKIKGYVIYCDAPYKGTTKYKTETFPYEKFYDWCREMSIHNTVLISEYNMPEDFECIWQKEVKVNFDSNRKSNNEGNERVERLYTYKSR